MLHKLGWALSGAMAVVAILALARATVAGPLDPPGPVGSTMRTLDELLPSWGKTLSSTGGCASKRFTCVLPTAAAPTGEAVLDHETGLVWQRVPSAGSVPFLTADDTCRTAKIGGRYGWRLPTIDELLSLDDDTTADSLPAGHPFTNAPDTYLWSQTTDATDAQRVQTMTFLLFGGGFSVTSRPRFGFNPSDNARAWCVRGAGGDEAQIPDEQPAWSRALNATGGCFSERFSCVLNNEAVLDRETGLVWVRDANAIPGDVVYALAEFSCAYTRRGGREGWRVPTASELRSLSDTSVVAPLPSLPAGHPFLNVPTGYVWTSTSSTDGDRLFFDFLGNAPGQSGTGGIVVEVDPNHVWCVRG